MVWPVCQESGPQTPLNSSFELLDCSSIYSGTIWKILFWSKLNKIDADFLLWHFLMLLYVLVLTVIHLAVLLSKPAGVVCLSIS